MKMQRILSLTLTVIIAAIAAIYACGFAYDSFLTPRSSKGSFDGIYGDSWLVDGATVTLYGLAPRGNWLDIRASDWHPAERAVPHIRALVCGKEASIFHAVKGSTSRIYLTGACEPREVTFDVQNPFVASETDPRQLGVQIHSVSISSQPGVALVSPYRLLGVAGLLFVGGALLWYWLRNSKLIWLSALVPLAGGYLIATSEHLDYTRAISLWIFILSLAAGRMAGSGLFKTERRWFRIVRDNATPEKNGETWNGLISLVCITLIVLLAGLLRFYSIDFGLPANYHPDEVPKYNAIMRMRAHGDLNPRYFLHPTLLLYATYFSNELLRLLGLVDGTWEQSLILSGRMMSATAGTFSVLMIFLIARRLYSVWVGLFASLFLAVMPLHVTCSRYVKEDALLTFAILLAVWAVVKAVHEDRIRWLLAAAFFAGVSASIKYSGMLSLMIILGAPWLKSGRLTPDWRFLRWTLLAVVVMPAGMLLCSPYIILDNATFLKDFEHERAHMERGHSTGISAWSQYWMYHFSRSIYPGVGLLGTICGLAGAGYLLYRRRMKDLFIICLFLLFYLPAEYVKAKPAPQPERYILPCLPFLAIFAGLFLKRLSENRLRNLAPLLVMLVLILPALRTTTLAKEIGYDTREELSDWMLDNLPHGSVVAVDWKPYSVRFEQNEFEMAYLPRAEIIPSLTIEDLQKQGYDYLVLSNLFYRRYFKQPNTDPALREHIRQVFRRLPIMHEVEAPSGTYGFHNPRLTLFSLKEPDYLALQQELKLKEAGELEKTSNEMKASFNWKE